MIENSEKVKKIALEIVDLHNRKNAAYGDSVSKTAKILEILYGDSIPKDRYEDLHTIIRILDKISRMATGDKKAFDESPWTDVAGYALSSLVRAQDTMSEEKKNKTEAKMEPVEMDILDKPSQVRRVVLEND